MILSINKQFYKVGINEARNYAKVYHLDENHNDLMIVDEVDKLDISGRSFQTGLVMVCFCKAGYVDFEINGITHRLTDGSLLVCLGDSMISNVVKSDDFSATAIVVSQDFLQESVMSLAHLWPYIIYLMDHPIIKLGETERWRLSNGYSIVINRLQQTNHAFRHEATIASLQACFLDVCDVLRHRAPASTENVSRSFGIFDQFIRMASKSFIEHRNVQWYAEQLSLTPKYLSEVVKVVSGRTAGQWITNFVISEIKSLLRNSDLSIKEIAVEMNFANQSFLGKYFKNIVGMSPLDYRNKD